MTTHEGAVADLAFLLNHYTDARVSIPEVQVDDKMQGVHNSSWAYLDLHNKYVDN